ncbi:C-type lectin domain family 4 member G-like [Labeo rohita]|uniref:C-type lectin domain family 4 member G-like n=1 Tax=Labeo rohita TaxID=84645 RepID=UPI0021E2C0C7|nr:C-type lectin domain family 4 member G-like [Labeo rohita]
MGLEDIYENAKRKDIQNKTGPQTQSHAQDEDKDQKRSGSRCLVLMTVSLWLICVLLLVFIILQHITITAERDLIKSYKNTVEEFNQTINSLQGNYTDLMIEKHQLQNNFSFSKKLELETKSEELKEEASKQGWFFMSSELKSWSDSRQYCRDRGADLVIIKSEEKQNITITAERDLIKSYKNTVEEFNQTINSLQGNYTDLMNEKHQLQNNFSSLSQKKLELETRVKDLTAEKDQLQRNVDVLNQKKLELETGVTSLSSFFMSEERSWSESRQYCKDHGADLVIIKSEKKQRNISSFTKERVWIGLSDIHQEGNMKWVDNSPLNLGFWLKGEPNGQGGNEDCIELMPSHPVLNNWNDFLCSEKRKGICEK